MHAYIARRLLASVPAFIGLSIVVFALIRSIPGDVVVLILFERGFNDPQVVAEVRESLGLDRPWYEQYYVWVWNGLQGDFGKSLWTREPVLQSLVQRLPVTAELTILSIVFATVIAIPIGVISAARQDTPVDYVLRTLSIAGLSVPEFWVGTLLILALSLWVGWLPPITYTPPWVAPWQNLQQFFFPSLALGVALAASEMRMVRSSLLEVLRHDYIRTARAKGLVERNVLFRHALKNAFIPVLTLMGHQIGRLLGGTVVVEQIYGLPGIGLLTIDSVLQRDYPQIQLNVLFFAVIFLCVNLLVDLLYAWFDPRIRYA